MTEKNIYQKLQAIRVELQSCNLKKSGENKFAKFKYYELSDILPTINDILSKYNLCSVFSILENTASLIITDGEKEIIFYSPIADAELKGCTPVQSLGAIHTYLKRYLYLNAFEIVEADILNAISGQDEAIQTFKKADNNLKKEIEEIKKIGKDDKDIYTGLHDCKTIAECNAYLLKYKNEVNDVKEFTNAYTAKCAKLKEKK